MNVIDLAGTQGLGEMWPVYAADLGRMAMAAACGAVVGWQRERHEKAAGLRTHMLLAIGACLFTLVALRVLPNGIAPVMQGIVTGTGFLAGGVIFREGVSVRGLTTAVGLWLMGAVGLAVGVGEYFVAILATLLTFIILSVLQRVEQKYGGRPDKGPAEPGHGGGQ